MKDNNIHRVKPKEKYGKPIVSGILRACIVAILMLVQIVFIVSLSLIMTKYTVFLYVLLEIASLIVIIALMNDTKSIAYRTAWIMVILVLPLTGHIMFILWGASSNEKEDKKILSKLNNSYKYNISSKVEKATKEVFYKEYPMIRRQSDYLSAENFPLYKNNKINYYEMGDKAFNAIIDDIYKAEKFVLLDFFIVAEGELWDRIHKALIDRVKHGVEVKFLYDDFGAMFRTNKYFRYNLEKEGIEVQVFNPIHKYMDKLYFNYRSHQKIVVIDGNIGYTGGMNIADEYTNTKKRFGRWKDTAVRIEGEAVRSLTLNFLAMWDIASEDYPIDFEYYLPTKKFPENNSFCQIVTDGPANNPNNPIENLYISMINLAQDYLYITTPYLVIEEKMKNALVVAAKSGVDVRIITPYIPDKRYVKAMTNYNYGDLLRAGIKIYEYKPGFIHAKNIVNDNSAIVGTINMDYRSFYLHYECGAYMCDKKVVNEVKYDFMKTLEECIEITYEEWKNRPFMLKVAQKVLILFQTLL